MKKYNNETRCSVFYIFIKNSAEFGDDQNTFDKKSLISKLTI